MIDFDVSQLPKIDKDTRQWFYANHLMGKTAPTYKAFYWRFWDKIYRKKDISFIKQVFDKQKTLRAYRQDLADGLYEELVGGRTLKRVQEKYDIVTEPEPMPQEEQEYEVEENPHELFRMPVPRNSFY